MIVLAGSAGAHAKSINIDPFGGPSVVSESVKEKAIIEFSMASNLAQAIEKLSLINVANGERFDIHVDRERQVLSLPAGVYRPDFKQLGERLYGTGVETTIQLPEQALVTVKPNAVTYLGKWKIAQSRAHSGLFASIDNRQTSLTIEYGSAYQQWVARDAGALLNEPLVTTRLGTGQLIPGEWLTSDRAVVAK